MHIDIDNLTEAELVDLNHRVVARLNLLRRIRDHKQMLEFEIGDRVSFTTQGGQTVLGRVSKFNRKTLTVLTDCNHQWNVSPALLRRLGGEPRTVTVTVRPFVEEKQLQAGNKQSEAPLG